MAIRATTLWKRIRPPLEVLASVVRASEHPSTLNGSYPDNKETLEVVKLALKTGDIDPVITLACEFCVVPCEGEWNWNIDRGLEQLRERYELEQSIQGERNEQL